MNKDKQVLYTISFLTFAVLLASLLLPIKLDKLFVACLLIALAVLTRITIRKKVSYSINKKEVIFLSLVLGVLYVILVQFTGVYFGFYKNPYFVKYLNPEQILTIILPLIAIIVSTELIRSTLLAQKNKLVTLLAFLSCVLADMLAVSNLAGITNFNKFMDLMGLTLFPAVSANIYYHFASKRYGPIPNIVFRLITTLYAYALPTLTGMSDAIFSMIKLAMPIVMLALIAALFEKQKKTARKKASKLSAIAVILSTAVVASIAMLISCQFRYGAIVIATGSMTGEINKGDMIIYEQYKDQKIEEGQVIVFLQNRSRIIHRVVKIEQIGGETRYYTKGDANPTNDIGYRTDADIVGLTDMKLAYAGYPTLWLREIMKK